MVRPAGGIERYFTSFRYASRTPGASDVFSILGYSCVFEVKDRSGAAKMQPTWTYWEGKIKTGGGGLITLGVREETETRAKVCPGSILDVSVGYDSLVTDDDLNDVRGIVTSLKLRKGSSARDDSERAASRTTDELLCGYF